MFTYFSQRPAASLWATPFALLRAIWIRRSCLSEHSMISLFQMLSIQLQEVLLNTNRNNSKVTIVMFSGQNGVSAKPTS